MASKQSRKPLLDEYEGKECLTASDFIRIFKEFDKDGNGYIESKELDSFLLKLLEEKYDMNVSSARVQQWKDYILKNYDTNKDKRLELKEVASILPTDENALLNFSLGTKLTSVDFMKIWNYYDPARDGFIGGEELEAFCRDLLARRGNKVTADSVTACVKSILRKYDKNRDDTVDLAEMAKLVGVEENFFDKIGISNLNKISKGDFLKIWNHYNQDGTSAIGKAELDALIRDYYTKLEGVEPDMDTINRRKDVIMAFIDKDGDEEVGKNELYEFFVRAKGDRVRKC